MKFLLNPSIFFVFYLILLSTGAFIFFDSSIPFLLFLFVLSVLLGFLLSLPPDKSKKSRYYVDIKQSNKFFWIALFFWSIAQINIVLSLVVYFDISNPSFTKDLVTNSFFENEGLAFKDTGKGLNSILNTLLYILGFPSLILGSFLLVKEKNKFGLTPLFLGALTSLISFSRFHMFIYISIFIFSFLCFKKLIGEKIKITKHSILTFLIIILLFSVPAFLRDKGGDSLDMFNYLSVYLFGGISAFSKWFNSSPLESHQWGSYNGTSFYSLKAWLSYLKLVNPPGNLHYEFIDINEKDYTNVYSLFRPLTEDFGIYISVFIFFVFSFVSNILYRKVIIYKSIEYAPLLVFLLTFSLFIFYTSIFSDFRIFLGSVFTVGILKRLSVRRNILN